MSLFDQRVDAEVVECDLCNALFSALRFSDCFDPFKDCGMDRAPRQGIYKNMRIICKTSLGCWVQVGKLV